MVYLNYIPPMCKMVYTDVDKWSNANNFPLTFRQRIKRRKKNVEYPSIFIDFTEKMTNNSNKKHAFFKQRKIEVKNLIDFFNSWTATTLASSIVAASRLTALTMQFGHNWSAHLLQFFQFMLEFIFFGQIIYIQP